MSRIGKKPLTLPGDVTIAVDGAQVTVKGPRGEMSYNLPEGLSLQVVGAQAEVVRSDESRRQRSLHGLSRSLLANMVVGVTSGFKRQLVIEGTGFRAQVEGNRLSLALGFAYPKIYIVPEGITVSEQQGTRLTVEGNDKALVGQVAARIRSYYPVEPYKGKGIKYADEVVRRKQGKTVA